ncbi:MAG: transglycosylase domain-containing protein, partial [Clostridia bacterium]|nr:transglycosylase domain-containing protein [Clostridia bacterium]
MDYIRIGGAIVSNIKSHSFSQGASTISQQLIKNTQLSSEKTIKRKLKEFKLTKALENKYSKNQILEMYLNNIYFG